MLPHRHSEAFLGHPRTATTGATQSAKSSPSITRGCRPCCGRQLAPCSPGSKRWRQGLHSKGKERWARWPSKPSAACQRRTMSGTTKTETARKRGRRYSLSSLCLGMGALTVALLARLLAHKPRCPGASRTQPPCQPEGRWPIQICVGVKLRL